MAASPSSNTERFAILSKEERDLLLKDDVPTQPERPLPFGYVLSKSFALPLEFLANSKLLTKTPDLASWNDSIVALERKTVVSTSAPATLPQEALSRDTSVDGLERSIPLKKECLSQVFIALNGVYCRSLPKIKTGF